MKINITEYHISDLTQEIHGFEKIFSYVPVIRRVVSFNSTKKTVLVEHKPNLANNYRNEIEAGNCMPG